MESFAKYLLNKPDLKSRIFVSDPPGAALLLWANKSSLPKINDISIVEMEILLITILSKVLLY